MYRFMSVVATVDTRPRDGKDSVPAAGAPALGAPAKSH
jgi:hypothetical protein